MPVVQVKGKILPPPPALALTFNDLPQLQWADTAGGQTYSIVTKIVNSEIDLEFSFNHYDPSVIGEIFKRAWDVARAAVDAYCYLVGWGLTVYLETFVDPNGNAFAILPKEESLTAYCTAFDPKVVTGHNSFGAFYELLVKEPALFMALNDLIVSITLPHHAAVNCARAIEGLRVLMVPLVTERRHAWQIFQDRLNIDRAYREYVTDISTGPRHGDRTFIPGIVVNETTKRSWIIMNRFLEYRKSGNQALPITSFPILVG